MTVERVNQEIEKFMLSDEPEIMAIKGDWGVGKTYNWEKTLLSAKKEKLIGLNNYSYVSLFGIDSLSKFKYAIFENKIDINQIGIEANLSSFAKNWSSINDIFHKAKSATKLAAKFSTGEQRAIPAIESISLYKSYYFRSHRFSIDR